MCDMLYPEYKKKRIVPTRSAYHELEKLRLDLFDALDILEKGYDCPRAKREKGILERCLRRGKKLLRAVLAEGQFSYANGYVEDVYWLIHISEETVKRRRKR